jgi:hypothetical protein
MQPATSPPPPRVRSTALPRWVLRAWLLSLALLLPAPGTATPPNVRGKITGYDKLVGEVYAEASKTGSRRWTWREPSPAVHPRYRALSPSPSRDICVAALTSGTASPPDQPILMTLTGGRVVPTTIVVAPKTKLSFQNFDPFPHRLYIVGSKEFVAADMAANARRDWSAPGPGRYEVRDELFPSVRTYIVVDPQVVMVTYPGRDGSFGFSLSPGDYVLKAFFGGKQVGKPATATAKERTTLDLKDPLNVGEGADGK